MKNKWAKILLLSGVLMSFPTFSESNIKNVLPIKFKNYKDKTNIVHTENKIFKYWVFKYPLKYKYYHTLEGKVLEIYLCSKNGDLKYKYPLIYAFDKNDNGKFERLEYLKDDETQDKPDGLNGNEIPLTKWEFSLIKYVKNE